MKVRVKPSNEHSHSNRTGEVVHVHGYLGGFDVLVEVVSPTRRPSLISHTTYRRAIAPVNFHWHELDVIG